MVASTGPMHGAQPAAKAMPRGNAHAVPRGTRAMSSRFSRWRNGTRSTPEGGQSQPDDDHAEDPDDGVLVAQEHVAQEAGAHAQGGEHEAEAAHEQQRRPQRDAPGLALAQLRHRQGRDVGQVAGQQRQAARRAEREQTGHDGQDRQRHGLHGVSGGGGSDGRGRGGEASAGAAPGRGHDGHVTAGPLDWCRRTTTSARVPVATSSRLVTPDDHMTGVSPVRYLVPNW